MLARAARRYRSTLWLCAFVIAGWLWDFALGAGRAHSAAWLGALVVVGGISALAARHSQQPAQPDGNGAASEDSTASTNNAASEDSTASKDQADTNSAPVIRPALPTDFATLIEVEQAADKLFKVAGYGTTPGPASVAELAAAPLLLVAGEPPVGYARAELVDGRPHLEGLSVRPSSMRRGIGSALVQAVCEWARAAGYPELTLCTFADVPWNGPFYAGLGFVELAELSAGLKALRATEQRLGLDAMGRRIVMVRRLDD
jgi:GNAT superfamily N-acetyltransferase